MFALLFAVALATDSTVYPVLNHDRPAGSMVVVRHGDSVTVRWIFTDRNRGTRVETRYVFRDGHIVFSENRPILADDRSGEPTSRLEVVGDSIRRWTPARTTTAAYDADVYYGSTFTPFDEVALARFLLRRPDHTTKLPGPTSPAMRLDVVKETSIQTSHGKERARLVALYRGTTDTPEMVWLDGNDDLLATEVGWFITVKPGAETALPALRKIETEFRDAKAEAMNRRLMKTTSGTIAIVHGDVFDSERGVVRPQIHRRRPRRPNRGRRTRRFGERSRGRHGHRRRRQDRDARPVGDAQPHATLQRVAWQPDAAFLRDYHSSRPGL